MRLCFVVGVAAWLAICPAQATIAQDQQATHAAAIAAIRKLGGEVKVGPEQAGAPVSVILAGARQPSECLPHLARITNLHTCDL